MPVECRAGHFKKSHVMNCCWALRTFLSSQSARERVMDMPEFPQADRMSGRAGLLLLQDVKLGSHSPRCTWNRPSTQTPALQRSGKEIKGPRGGQAWLPPGPRPGSVPPEPQAVGDPAQVLSTPPEASENAPPFSQASQQSRPSLEGEDETGKSEYF